jgi:hypothetical protein
MKLIKFLPLLLIPFAVKPIRNFFNKYKVGVYYIDKTDTQQYNDVPRDAMDLRGRPTHACICGSHVWNLKATFEDYEIGTYLLEMQCAECGSLATAPTPLDRENME